jgi:hypothetical protein
MPLHLLRCAALTACVLLMAALPFLPGSYDPLATTLWMLARVFGFVALLLVPVGVLWAASTRRRPRAASDYAFARAALVVAGTICGVLSFAALMINGWSLALACLALSVCVVVRLQRGIASLKGAAPVSAAVPALYLVACRRRWSCSSSRSCVAGSSSAGTARSRMRRR